MDHERPDDFALVRLVLARQRRLGASFERAWPLALGAVPMIEGKGIVAVQRSATLGALEWTRRAWQAAYERREPPRPKHGRAAMAAKAREMQSRIAA